MTLQQQSEIINKNFEHLNTNKADKSETETLNANFNQLQEENKVSNAYITGSISTEKKMLEQIKEMKFKAFNSNKTGVDQIKEDNYTKSHNDIVVTNGIFDIVATNAGWKYVSVPINLKKEDNWEFWGSFTTPDVIDTSLTANTLGTGVASNDILSFGCNYRYDLVTPRVYNDNDTFSSISDIGATNNQVHLPSPFTPNTKYIYYFKNNVSGLEFGIKKETDTEFKIGVGPALTGTMRTGYNAIGQVTKEKLKAIDLNDYKQFVNGSLVYQATLQIPYTLSKTGSKIVDAVYRNRVQDCYNYQGSAPYYTLSDVDFTLPMGEIYGMKADKLDVDNELSQKANADLSNSSVPHIIETFVDGLSGYRIWSDGYCEQWGNVVANGNVTINLLKSYDLEKTGGMYAIGNGLVDTWHDCIFKSLSSSSFVLGTGGNTRVLWKTSGYLQEGEY